MARRVKLGFLAGVAALVIAPSIASLVRADTLGEIQSRGELVWGADQEGGGPYVYPSDDDPSAVTGFEVELAERLAKALGVRSRFFQGQWNVMPELLRSQKIDVILNGYEWMPARLETLEATLPYFVYGLQLLARRSDSTLEPPPISRSAAHRRGRSAS